MNFDKNVYPTTSLARLATGVCAAALMLCAGAALAASKDTKSAVSSAQVAEANRPPVLPAEEADTAVLDAAGPHRFLLVDPYMYSGAHVLEGDDKELAEKGLVPSAKNGAFAMSADGGKIYIAETYWSRGDRGAREDLLTIYDGKTLSLEKEIVLPSRLLVVPKLGQIGTNLDGSLAYVYSMVPASQVHVIDLKDDKILSSVDIPGCALAYPFGARSFATICGDGTLGVASVGPAGESTPKFTKPFFDADNDPLFENSVVDRATGEGWFLSFTGKVYPANLSGAAPMIDKPWSLNVAAGLPAAGTGAQELAWRPGGGQLMALHRKTKHLFVLMHAGNYWTHKEDGAEVWVFDADKRSLIKRIKLAGPTKGIAVSQDDAPLLYAWADAMGPGGGVSVMKVETGEVMAQRRVSGSIGLVPGL